MKMKRIGWVLLLSALSCGCDTASEKSQATLALEKGRFDLATEQKSRENCLKRGGVVILSSWDGTIKDCK